MGNAELAVLPETTWLTVQADGRSEYPLLVMLGRSRKALAQAARADLWQTLAQSALELTGSVAVSVATIDDDRIDELAATTGPSADRQESGHPYFTLRASAGQVDVSVTAHAGSVMHMPVELHDQRIGTVTLLARQGNRFSFEQTEATRQLISSAVQRLSMPPASHQAGPAMTAAAQNGSPAPVGSSVHPFAGDVPLGELARAAGMISWSLDVGTGQIRTSGDSHLGMAADATHALRDIISWADPRDVAALNSTFRRNRPQPGQPRTTVGPLPLRLCPHGGATHTYQLSAVVKHAPDGTVLSVAGVAVDRTGLAEAETRSDETNSRLTQAQERLAMARADVARAETELSGIRSEKATARAELQISRDLFHQAFDLATQPMALLEISAEHPGRLLRANRRLADLLGYHEVESIAGKEPTGYVHLADVPTFHAQLRALAKAQTDQAVQPPTPPLRFLTQAGDVVDVRVSPSVSAGAPGQPQTPYAICRVVANGGDPHGGADGPILTSERLFEVTFEKSPVGMLLLTMAPGREGSVVTVNPAMVSMLRTDEESLADQGPRAFMADAEADALVDLLNEMIRRGKDNVRVQRQLIRSDGEPLFCWISALVVDDTTSGGPFVLCHVEDVTSQRNQQKALERMALTDSLTRLPNRSLFTARVDQALSRMGPGSKVALMVLDLDRFKNVNDTLGHHVGDLLLLEVAGRLGSVRHGGLSVARQGGDEFAVLVDRVEDDYQVVSICEELLALLTGDYDLQGYVISTSVSIGVAIAEGPDRTREQLLREADLALYAAKEAGRDRFILCDEQLLERAAVREDAEQRLRRALAGDGLRVLFQPIVSLRTGALLSMEALVRVYEPQLGLLEPNEIIEVAEEAGLINELDRRVMDEAIRCMSVDPRFIDHPEARVNINVSGKTVDQSGLATYLSDVLSRYHIPGNRVTIELTESSLLHDDPVIRHAVLSFQRLGARVGIDDFGTGYSALSYLGQFDLDFLKIDRSFITRIAEDERSRATAAAIISLAHAHGLRVTAEGIENEEQAQVLRELDCDAGQGWLFGLPTPSEAVDRH